MEFYIGGIYMFGGNFAIRAYALCYGQLLPIASNSALFSILGTVYGGDGRTTFGLPDFRGRAPIGPGNGAGLPSYALGQRGGLYQNIMNVAQMPSHNHTAATTTAIGVSTSEGSETNVNGNYLANHPNAFNEDPTAAANLSGATSTTTVGLNGGNQAQTNMQPYLAINFLICTQGLYPSRN